MSGVTYAVYPGPFASNAAQGSANASADGDPGQLQVCVDYLKNGTYYKQTSASFSNTNFTGATFMPSVTDLKTGGVTGQCP